MGQSMQMTLASVWDWLADLSADKYFVFEIVLLFGIGFVVNRAVNRVVDAQREIAVGLRQELYNLSNKLSSFEEVTVDRLMADIHRRIGHKYAESNGEAIRRWLDYRDDYGRSSPNLNEDDAKAEALEEIFKEIKRSENESEDDKTR